MSNVKVTGSIESRLIDWFLNGNTGASSMAIVRAMVQGKFHKDIDHPRDPSDLLRCMKLIERIPEFGARINEMHVISKEWAFCAMNWESLTKLNAIEVKRKDRRASETYALMGHIFKCYRTDEAVSPLHAKAVVDKVVSWFEKNPKRRGESVEIWIDRIHVIAAQESGLQASKIKTKDKRRNSLLEHALDIDAKNAPVKKAKKRLAA